MIKNFNNKTEKVGDEIKQDIKSNSKIDVAAAIFSIYGFQVLKKELSKIDKLRFVFTDPTFVEINKKKKEQRKFEINSNSRKRAIGGTDFEINLKNKLEGKVVAKECKEWIVKKASFKSNSANYYIQPHFSIKNKDENIVYTGINEFSSAGFGYEKDNSILNQAIKTDDYETTKQFLDRFEEIWNDENLLTDITDEVVDYISNLYKENPPEFIYYLILYNIFDEFLEDISEDELANEKTGFKESVVWNRLYDFQRDAVLGVINKLERYNGCILADSVGLGKTFSALGVVKYYQERNRSILVLCPKKLGDNWQTFLNNYDDNILLKDRLNYDVLYHTDLSREKGYSNNIDLSRINWSNYDLVVIDESHNFRNNDPKKKDKQTRYQKLLEDVMKKGVKTKVLMLSATPVNNRFNDLRNQIALAYEGKTDIPDENMNTDKSIDSILKNAQKIFNEWSKLPMEQRTTGDLLNRLSSNFDFFKLLDSITIARSRKHVEKYYDMDQIGKFPNRLPPVTLKSPITEMDDFLSMEELYQKLTLLNLSVYSPFEYILDEKKDIYSDLYDTDINETVSLRQINREKSLQKLMRVNFLKRLESSVEAFRITLEKFIKNVKGTIDAIDDFEKNGKESSVETTQVDDLSIDIEGENWIDEDFSIGDKVKINLKDMNTLGWREDLKKDYEQAKEILKEMKKITPDKDKKLSDLKDVIDCKIENPINDNNKKILIFSAFADTVNYLYQNISLYAKENHGLESAKVVGTDQNDCTLNIDKQFNNILINFSPRAKERRGDKETKEIDILIATDCISEGQNLQDCDYLINYDIHWNPVKIIQRFGRIDRIGSKNKDIQLVNFWPNISLEEYINLKKRVEARMHVVGATAAGENVLTNESVELEYRKKQLERLQEEVVDLEEMNSGISITDLGLNDFRMDLVNYIKENGSLDDVPNGMHAVCSKDLSKDIRPGAIFVLKNINQEVNINNTNQLHPFYLVYIGEDEQILSNHLNVKNTLDILRIIAKGKSEPLKEVYEKFNEETDDGRKMDKYSELLNHSIQSILEVKEESDIDSLFSAGGTSALVNNIKGLSDFELIAFMVIK